MGTSLDSIPENIRFGESVSSLKEIIIASGQNMARGEGKVQCPTFKVQRWAEALEFRMFGLQQKIYHSAPLAYQ